MKNLVKRFLVMSVALTLSFSALAGGGSDGGGNVYKGKPLESYAKKPETLAAYHALIAPLLKDIVGKKQPDNRFDILSNLISSVFSQKIWYFVPGPLDQIPSELLNSAVRTDQAALQGYDRVWVDEDIWNKMTTLDQARLLLHEAFMGLKILQFASPHRLCQAAWGVNYNCNAQDTWESTIQLKASDYTDVQRLTVDVSMDYPRMDFQMWTAQLQRNNIRYSYDWFDQVVKMDRSDLASRLSQSTISGFIPSHGYNMRSFDDNPPPLKDPKDLYDYFQKNQESCQLKAEVQGDSLKVQLNSGTENFAQIIPLPEKIESTFADLYHEGKNLQRIGFLATPGTARPNGGYTAYIVWLSFDSIFLANVSLQEMVCTNKDCKGAPYVDVKGGLSYICSGNAHLFKP